MARRSCPGRRPLLALGSAALGELWRCPITVERKRIDHHDRAVFDTLAPDGRRVVVKVDTRVERFRRERSVLDAAAAAGVPVPEVVAAREGDPSILALAWMDGTELDDRAGDESWVAAGDVLRKLHRVSPPAREHPGSGQAGALSSMYDHLDLGRGHPALPSSVAGLVDELYQRLAALAPPPALTLIHGDASPQHVLCSNQGVALIDFGDAEVGDPAWDVAVLTLHDRHRLDAVLDGYQADDRFESHVDAVLPTYQLVRLIGAVAWLADHGFPADRELAELRRRGAAS